MGPEAQGLLAALLAGSCTALGGAAIFFIPPSRATVAGGMAAAAGVMTFVTLVEVFMESKHNFSLTFDSRPQQSALAMAGATGALVAGWVFADCLGGFVNWMIEKWDLEREVDICPTSSDGGDHSLDERTQSEDEEIKEAERRFQLEHSRFLRTGLFTTIALALHNFPEGMATYTGSLADAKLGIGLAVAIGAHNIPEGLAVAIPLQHAIGNKWAAFWYATSTGFAEPIGAFIAFAFMRRDAHPLVLAIAFGLVAGVMLNIALKELFIMAVLFDPKRKIVPHCFAGGMLFIALSLVALDFAENA